jgi:hypothetical protein
MSDARPQRLAQILYSDLPENFSESVDRNSEWIVAYSHAGREARPVNGMLFPARKTIFDVTKAANDSDKIRKTRKKLAAPWSCNSKRFGRHYRVVNQPGSALAR